MELIEFAVGKGIDDRKEKREILILRLSPNMASIDSMFNFFKLVNQFGSARK